MEAQDINRMTYFQTKENVMKNQEQTNNLNNLNDPTVANVPQSQVEFDDLPISSEQEEQVKGGPKRHGEYIQVLSFSTGLHNEQSGATTTKRS
jgi:hypothetical protein